MEDLAYKPYKGRTLSEWSIEEINAEIEAIEADKRRSVAAAELKHKEELARIEALAQTSIEHLSEMRTEKFCHMYEDYS